VRLLAQELVVNRVADLDRDIAGREPQVLSFNLEQTVSERSRQQSSFERTIQPGLPWASASGLPPPTLRSNQSQTRGFDSSTPADSLDAVVTHHTV
jgi:hypothetical protein